MNSLLTKYLKKKNFLSDNKQHRKINILSKENLEILLGRDSNNPDLGDNSILHQRFNSFKRSSIEQNCFDAKFYS